MASVERWIELRPALEAERRRARERRRYVVLAGMHASRTAALQERRLRAIHRCPACGEWVMEPQPGNGRRRLPSRQRPAVHRCAA